VDPLVPLARELGERAVRFVVIGVGGANYYAHSGPTLFTTEDRDLFLPLDPQNLLNCWSACGAAGLELWAGDEPLDSPRDTWLAERVIERRAAVKAAGPSDLHVDLTLVMAGFDFEDVWRERRTFEVGGVQLHVARLRHIVQSKHAAGRDKDRLFLATHREALQELLDREARESS
jgi:hypothetical protein